MSTAFKLSRRDGGLIRRVVFPPSAAKPSWNALSARIHTLFNIPIEQVAVSYIDADNDEVTLSSEDELRDYYETSPHGEIIKFVVQDLNLFRDTPGNNVGEEALLVDVEDNWQRLPPLSGTEATDSDAFIPVVGSEAGDAPVPSSSRGTASPVPPTESTGETATTATVDDPSDPPVPTINPQPLLTNDIANILSTVSPPELSEGLRNIVQNATNGVYWNSHRAAMSRAAGEFMQTTAEVARHQAEEQAGQRVGQAMSGLFRSFTQVLGGANTAQADTAATSAPWLPPACAVPSQPKGGRACANESTSQAEREADVDANNPEAGWDDHTDPTAVVRDYHSRKTVTRRVAFTAKMFTPAPAKVNGPDDAWSFEKIFGDGDFMAAGQLVIPEGKRKSGEGTKDNTNIFFVVEGAVNVMIHDTSVVLATGGMFMVPRGNSYFIENIAERPAKLFFTQARQMRDDDDEELALPRGVSVPMDAWTSVTASVEESR